MKIRSFLIPATLFVSSTALAQAFDVGSNGTQALTVTSNTDYPLPPDGVVHVTTLDVAAGVTLRFTPNDANTPVTILATNDVTIEGTLDLSGDDGSAGAGGAPGPGGFRGGVPGIGGVSGGAGLGPGGGEPASSAAASITAAEDCSADHDGSQTASAYVVNRPYGTELLTPINGGSGGGGAGFQRQHGGGGGGGAILIASNTRITVNGRIDTYGGDGFSGYCRGSGGDIRLVAPTVQGTGVLGESDSIYYSSGRYRVDTFVRSSVTQLLANRSDLLIGGYMVARPSVPTLEITSVDNISTSGVLTNGVAFYLFGFNSPTQRTVRVTPRGFSTVVTVELVASPDEGSATRLTQTFDPATQTYLDFTVDFPVNVQTDVAAYVY
jgi:hypothetical protein